MEKVAIDALKMSQERIILWMKKNYPTICCLWCWIIFYPGRIIQSRTFSSSNMRHQMATLIIGENDKKHFVSQ